MDDLSPNEFYLFQNYPNPFKEKTTIKYCVAYKTRVRITVFNIGGKMIEKLVDEEKEAGTYKVEFKQAVSNPPERNSEIQFKNDKYLYQLNAGNYSSDKQMILEK